MAWSFLAPNVIPAANGTHNATKYGLSTGVWFSFRCTNMAKSNEQPVPPWWLAEPRQGASVRGAGCRASSTLV